MSNYVIKNSIIGRLSNEYPELTITEDLTVKINDDLEKIIEAGEIATVFEDLDNEDKVPTKEEIETIKEAMSDIFKILIVDKKDYEAENPTYEDILSIIIIENLIKDGKYGDIEEINYWVLNHFKELKNHLPKEISKILCDLL